MKKSSKTSTKKRANAKEMREQLTEMGISIDGLKGKALTLKYNEVMDSQGLVESQLSRMNLKVSRMDLRISE